MSTKISSDGSTCVDTSYFWRDISTAPHGVKVQLLSKFGVATYGQVTQSIIEDDFFVKWAPLPKVPKDQ